MSYSGEGEITKGPRSDPTSSQNQIQVLAPVVSFGGDVIRPGGSENGGGGQGLTASASAPTTTVSPGTGVPLSGLSGASGSGIIPVSTSPQYFDSGSSGYMPAFFDTYNQGPTANISGIAIIAALVGGGALLILFLRSRQG